MVEWTIPLLFGRSAAQYADRPAVRNAKEIPGEPPEITYRGLEEMSDQTAAGLADHGIGPGDRVALISAPRIRYAAALLAVWKRGAWAVPIDPSWTREEVAEVFDRARPKLTFAPSDAFTRLPDDGSIRIDLGDRVAPTFRDLLAASPREPVPVKPDDIAVLAYTSGTTGQSKGVMLSHGNIAADLVHGTKVIPVFPGDVFLSIAPWHHILGLVACLILPLYGGALTIYTDDYRRIAELMKEHRVSIFVGVPKLYHAMYAKLMETVRGSLAGRILLRVAPHAVGRRIKAKLSGGALRFFVSGSAPLDPDVALGFRRLGIGMMEGYGLTETSPVISVCDPFGRNPGSVGRPIPGVEARLLDPGPDGVGELLVRGPIVMQGYYQDDAATRSAIDPDGWFHTGDLAAIDRKGEIYLKGRAKNVIVLETGKNVYPEELEWAIARVPYVQEVLVRLRDWRGRGEIEAAVYPNNERLQEEGLLERAHEAIWSAIRRQQERLAPYKRLRSRSQLVIVDRPFPKTSTMDIKRYLYRDRRALRV